MSPEALAKVRAFVEEGRSKQALMQSLPQAGLNAVKNWAQPAMDSVGNAFDSVATGVGNAVQGFAGPASTSNEAQLEAARRYAAEALAKNNIGNTLMAGLAVGGGAAGAAGLYNLLRRQRTPPKLSIPGPIEVQVPYPDEDFKEAEEKQAIESPNALPWYWSGLAGAGALGTYAGWKGIDAVLDQQRKQKLQAQLDSAKTDYEEALLAQYDRPKTAAEETPGQQLGRELDQLFDALEKKALFGDAPGIAANAYTLYGTGAGLGAAYLAYQLTKKRQQQALLRKAQQRRMRRAYESQPAPLYATPIPFSHLSGEAAAA